MRHTKFIEILWAAAPFYSWKDALFRRHIENCASCSQGLASREDARRVLIQKDEVGDLAGLWPAVKNGICGTPGGVSESRRIGRDVREGSRFLFQKTGLGWAAALAGLFLAFFATFWLVRYFEQVNGRGGGSIPTGINEQVQVHYINVGGEPAQTFVFQPYDSNIVIIWAGKTAEEK